MRASNFFLVLALVAIGGERVAAAACDPFYMTGVLCQNPTPVCELEGLAYACGPCSETLGGVLGNNCPTPGQTCLGSGSCVTGCTANYDAGVDGGCPAALPYCNAASPRTCAQCAAGTPHDPFCPLTAPSCNASSVCGCTADIDCNATPGAKCDTTGGVYGAGVCVITCSDNTGCTTGNAHQCAIDGGADVDGSPDGRCVECLATADCDAGQVCNTSANTCFTLPVVDAGPPDGGADAGDGGATLHDAGTADGGTSTRDATVSDGGEEETTETYPPGKIEGGGCSLLTIGAGGGSDSPVPPALLGFAGLAGLFFLRRSQRRSSKGRDERR
jgi:MYXO-CTERM domain-containing protein